MRTFNTNYANQYQLGLYIKDNCIDKASSVLIQIFTGKTEQAFALNLVKEIKELIPYAKIIGTTTAGEILDCDVLTNSTVISFSIFENTTVKTAIIYEEANDFKLGQTLAQQLVDPETKLMILFGNALAINGSEMLSGIETAGNFFKVAGGHAGNNGYFNSTFVFTEEGITDKGAVGASLNSDVLSVFNEYSLCWQGIGKVMTVTKSDKNLVYEIDNMNVIDVYRKYLGDKVANALPESATEFPLIIKRGSMEIARCPLRVTENGALGFIGNVEEGSKVLFSFGNVDMLINRSMQILELVSRRDLETIFLYSCTARRVFMQERIQEELVPLKNFASVCGFFTYGEYYQTFEKNNVLLNITTTILGLSEKTSVVGEAIEDVAEHKSAINFNIAKDNFVKGKKEILVEVLNNLVNAVTGELEEINRDLETKNVELSIANESLKKYAIQMKDSQNAMIEIEKAANLGHLIAGIAHNLKTPIMASSGGISILGDLVNKLEESFDKLPEKSNYVQITHEMTNWLDEARESLNYMEEIISTVHGQAGNIQTESMEKFTLEKVLARINILMMFQLQKSRCVLETSIHELKSVAIRGNVNDLVQVLSVLINNAIDSYAGKDGGRIDLTAKYSNGYIDIEVADQGTGISRGIREKIFKEMITTKGKRGMGLGLYIASTIIKGRFQGEIGFESSKEYGTHFRIRIPARG